MAAFLKSTIEGGMGSMILAMAMLHYYQAPLYRYMFSGGGKSY